MGLFFYAYGFGHRPRAVACFFNAKSHEEGLMTPKSSKSGPKRGPKPARPPVSIRFDAVECEPTSRLCAAELREFRRLVGVLCRRGTLSRVDPAAITDLARLKVALDRAYREKPFSPREVGILQGHIRGVRRELGLSLQSSRILTRVWPEGQDAKSYWRSKLGGGEPS
jgi:hypothetical protein